MFNSGSLSCLGFTWPADGTRSGNTVYGIGAGHGSAATTPAGIVGGATTAVASHSAAIVGGWPLTETTLQRTDITSQTILAQVTEAELAAVGYPVPTPTMRFRADAPSPQLGLWIVGDDARFRVPPGEPWFPAGIDQIMRIVAHTVADDGTSTVEIDFDLPPLF